MGLYEERPEKKTEHHPITKTEIKYRSSSIFILYSSTFHTLDIKGRVGKQKANKSAGVRGGLYCRLVKSDLAVLDWL